MFSYQDVFLIDITYDDSIKTMVAGWAGRQPFKLQNIRRPEKGIRPEIIAGCPGKWARLTKKSLL